MSNGRATSEKTTSPNHKHEKRRRGRREESSSSSADGIREPLQRKSKVNHDDESTSSSRHENNNHRTTSTHKVLPSVNLYTALRDLKSQDVQPEQYSQPIERSIFAVTAASNVKELLKARHEALMARRLAVQTASSSSTATNSDDDGKSKSSEAVAGEKVEKSEVWVSIDDDDEEGGLTRPTKSKSRKHSQRAPLEAAFGSKGEAETSSTSYVTYYRAPRVTDMPWYKYLFHKQTGYKEYFRQNDHYRTGRDRLEWDASANQQGHSTSEVMEFYSSLNFFERLHEEVLAFMTWAELTSWEEQKRLEILARIEVVAGTLWPHSRIVPFGSFYTGLTLPHGDIDICVVNVPDYKRPTDLIVELSKALRKCRFARSLVAITRARIPIVKFLDDTSNVQVDISINQPSAQETSDLIREKLKEFPVLRPLIMTVKKLLDQLDLNETYQGGIGSYMLFTMCLAHIQAELRSRGAGFIREANMGCLLYGFLERYTGFNYYFNGIDVRHRGCFFDKREMTNDRDCPQPLLCIKSPLEPETDVGKNSYKFPEVIDRFKWRLDRLDSILDVERQFEKTADLEGLRKIRQASVLATIIRPDDKLFSTRSVSPHHPDQTGFSVFKSRAIPNLSHHMRASIRQEMDFIISKLERSRMDSLGIDRTLHASAMVRSHSAASDFQHRNRYSPYQPNYDEREARNGHPYHQQQQQQQRSHRQYAREGDGSRKVVVIEDEMGADRRRMPSSAQNGRRNLIEEDISLDVLAKSTSARGRKTNVARIRNYEQTRRFERNSVGEVEDDDEVTMISPPPPPIDIPPSLPNRNHRNQRRQDNDFSEYLRKPQAVQTVERW